MVNIIVHKLYLNKTKYIALGLLHLCITLSLNSLELH